MNHTKKLTLKFVALQIFVTIFLWGSFPAIARAQDEPKPPTAEPAADLMATIEAQDSRLTDLEGRWDSVADQNRFALDQAIFNFVTRPALFIGAIFAALGILLLWRSSGDIANRLGRIENENQRSLDLFRREQSQQLDAHRQETSRQIEEKIDQMRQETAEVQKGISREFDRLQREAHSVDGQMLRRAQQLLERVMTPIHLPRGYNLGHVYERLQLSGFENLCWYDNLGDRPQKGITLILIRSVDDAGRFRSLLTRFSPPPEPRKTAFILYLANNERLFEKAADLQIDFPNITLARTPLEIATQALTISWGLQSSGNIPHGSADH